MQAEYENGVIAKPMDPPRPNRKDTRLAQVRRSPKWKALTKSWTGEEGIAHGNGKTKIMPAPSDTKMLDVCPIFAQHVDKSWKTLVVRPQPWAV